MNQNKNIPFCISRVVSNKTIAEKYTQTLSKDSVLSGLEKGIEQSFWASQSLPPKPENKYVKSCNDFDSLVFGFRRIFTKQKITRTVTECE